MEFIRKLRNMVNIEKAYSVCDRAIGMVKNYADNPDSFTGEKKEELDEVVQEAEGIALRILGLEGQKSWPGIYREMRKNLATIYIDLARYEEAEEQSEKLKDYGPVGRLDSEEMFEKLQKRRDGSTDSEQGEKSES